MKVLFLGYGKMGSSLGEAWLKKRLVDQVVSVDPNAKAVFDAEIYYDISELPEIYFDLVVVAVKPALGVQAIATLPFRLIENACLVSIMAGVTCEALRSAIHDKMPIIRAMPNTPVLLNAGCTALYAPESLNQEIKTAMDRLFSSVGKSCWVGTEDLLHAVTAISGSGPAYFHLFSEALAEAGIELGLETELAQKLSAYTAFGAASQQCEVGANFVDLRLAVTSPNGTTDAAIRSLELNSALRMLVKNAAKAAFERSVQLSKTN